MRSPPPFTLIVLFVLSQQRSPSGLPPGAQVNSAAGTVRVMVLPVFELNTLLSPVVVPKAVQLDRSIANVPKIE